MIRVVLDVNVLVSGFPSPGGAPGLLIERWLRREFALVLSEQMLASVARAWRWPYFQARYQGGEPAQALALLRARGIVVTPATEVHGVADDEEDDLVTATAIAGQASYLVTGDRGLLRIEAHRGVKLITLRDFLTLLVHRGQSGS